MEYKDYLIERLKLKINRQRRAINNLENALAKHKQANADLTAEIKRLTDCMETSAASLRRIAAGDTANAERAAEGRPGAAEREVT